MIRVGLFLLLSCGISVEAFAGAFTFSGIGTLPGAVGSSSSGISADGKTIVGRSTKAGQSPQGFIWTAETGMHPAGPSTQRSVAIRGVSGDGSVVVGTEEISDTNALPFYWSNATGVVSFGQNLGASRSNSAWAASGDGSVIVGVGVNSKAMYEGYRWTEVGGFQWLGDLPGGRFESDARAVSYDGSVIVGSSSYSTTGWQAYRWTAGSGMVGLGLLPGASNSYAIDVSSDGRIVVGMSGFLSYIWREETGMVPLDSRLLGSAPGWLGAGSLSDDGRVVGGASLMGGGSTMSAVVWVNGDAYFLKDLLTANGATGLDNWTLSEVTGVSADGRTLTGVGQNPQGYNEAWVATIAIPEPATWLLGILGASALIVKLRRAP